MCFVSFSTGVIGNILLTSRVTGQATCCLRSCSVKALSTSVLGHIYSIPLSDDSDIYTVMQITDREKTES